jgi:hypothetical protein
MQNKDINTLALNWWDGLTSGQQFDIADKHDITSLVNDLPNEDIETLYKLEHPEQSTPAPASTFTLKQDGLTLIFEGDFSSCHNDYESSKEPNETETFFDWCKNSYPYKVAHLKEVVNAAPVSGLSDQSPKELVADIGIKGINEFIQENKALKFRSDELVSALKAIVYSDKPNINHLLENAKTIINRIQSPKK